MSEIDNISIFLQDKSVIVLLRESYALQLFFMRQLILANSQSPGDIVMLTAALRDLHLCHPGEFQTDVRTPFPELWENNPFITALTDAAAERIDCRYPLIRQSNQRPVHFLSGFTEFLSEALQIKIVPRAFKGDIHLSEAEKSTSPFGVGSDYPFWLIVAGGKRDYTIKWWSHQRYQAVVDALQGEVTFIQVGAVTDHHPSLRGVVDLRGKTTLRELIRLVYFSSGIVCPVTFVMHLAAAVETPAGMPTSRPCVVIAGGREPPHWEAYPTHQFIHTVGQLDCCRNGGCWKARTIPLGDNDIKDRPENLCVDVVNGLPRCMDIISTESVTSRIRSYLLPIS